MSVCQKATRPLKRCLRQSQSLFNGSRNFTSSAKNPEEASLQVDSSTATTTKTYDPSTTSTRKGVRELLKRGIQPIGSRRRRAALSSSPNIPFEQLPYQCFQEARKILQADREEKLQQIETERGRITRFQARDASEFKGGEQEKLTKLDTMQKQVERLKILADINDPLIKRRFEDGMGDMNKPIYRYLADKKWRSYNRLIIEQRIQQLALVPDILPSFEPTAEVRLAFRRRNVQPGDFVDSRVSEVPARLKVQVFDKGVRNVTVAVIDSDVPNVETDSFSSRLHYLATNIPISPTGTSLPLSKVENYQLLLPWLPPYSQKGAPYHRLSVWVLQQKTPKLENDVLKKKVKRDGFSLRSFCDKVGVFPIGVSIFRSIWDEGTAEVMARAGIPGADIEFKRKKIAPIHPPKKARGWEARHAGPKYNALRGGKSRILIDTKFRRK